MIPIGSLEEGGNPRNSNNCCHDHSAIPYTHFPHEGQHFL